MEISISLQSLARPILTDMIAYNWERWLEYDGASTSSADYYEQKIRFSLDYLAAAGIHCSTDRDTENGMFGGITINGEEFSIDFYGERQRFLDRYHPGETAVDFKAPAAASDSGDEFPILIPMDLDEESEEE